MNRIPGNLLMKKWHGCGLLLFQVLLELQKLGFCWTKRHVFFFEFATISLQDKDASGCSFSLMPLDVPPPRVMVLHHTEKLTFLAIRVDVLDLLGTSLYLWRSVLAAVCAHLSLGWKYPPSTDSFQLHSVASLIGLSIYVLIYLILSRPDWSCSFSFFRWQSMTRLALQWASQSPSSKLLMSWRPGANCFHCYSVNYSCIDEPLVFWLTFLNRLQSLLLHRVQLEMPWKLGQKVWKQCTSLGIACNSYIHPTIGSALGDKSQRGSSRGKPSFLLSPKLLLQLKEWRHRRQPMELLMLNPWIHMSH